jgi:hypothetical protein
VTIRPDIDSIPAIAEKRLSMWQMADQSQDLTINERRALKGYGPIEGGDTLFVSSTQIPLSMAGDTSLDMTIDEMKAVAYGSGNGSTPGR